MTFSLSKATASRQSYFVEAGRLRLERRTLDGRVLVLGTTPA